MANSNTKQCWKCFKAKPFDEFPIRSGKLFRYCKSCEYGKYLCDCGRTYTRTNYQTHLKSKLHSRGLSLQMSKIRSEVATSC